MCGNLHSEFSFPSLKVKCKNSAYEEAAASEAYKEKLGIYDVLRNAKLAFFSPSDTVTKNIK